MTDAVESYECKHVVDNFVIKKTKLCKTASYIVRDVFYNELKNGHDVPNIFETQGLVYEALVAKRLIYDNTDKNCSDNKKVKCIM